MTQSDPFVKAAVDAIIYLVNCFQHAAYKTSVLRDEEVTFGPTTGNYDPQQNHFIKPVLEILAELAEAPRDSESQENAFSLITNMVHLSALQFDPLKPQLEKSISLKKVAEMLEKIHQKF